MARFKKYSRYTNGFTFTDRKNKNFLILRSPLNLPPDSGDTYVTITQDIINRPDLISFKAYGTVDLWWAIYEYNNIKDPLFDLNVGQILKIPTFSRITAAIQLLGKT